MSDILLSQRCVLELTGLSRASLFRLRESGRFPAPLKIGERSILFKSGEVKAWLRANPPAPRVLRDPPRIT